VFATEEVFFGCIRNVDTRAAYMIAVKRFMFWAEARGRELRSITPRDVEDYLDVLDGLRKQNTSVATRKQHLGAIRHYFDGFVTRHATMFNPACPFVASDTRWWRQDV
jgi:site-specific recombinase XerD